MSETPTTPQAPARGILQRIAMPSLLFSGSLFAFLLLSWLFLIPQFTRFTVDGDLLGSRDLLLKRQSMQAELTTYEQKRSRIVLPIQDEMYLQLRAQKQKAPSVLSVRDAVLVAARKTLAGATGSVVVDAVQYDAATNQLSLVGDVRDVGVRSMTVLAQFTEQLTQLPFVASLTSPSFERIDDPKIGFHSPFRMQALLKDPVTP